MKTHKNHYNIVHDIVYQNASGFGWDPVNKCVTADKAVWTAYIQTHKAAAQFRGKQFKCYDELTLIFGSDRANGSGAVDHATATAQSSYDSELPIDISSDDATSEGSSQGTPVSVKKRKLSRDEALFAAMKENTSMIVGTMDRSTNKICEVITRSELHDKRVELAE